MSLNRHSYSVSSAEGDIVVVMNKRTATLVKDALEVVNPDKQCDEDVARNLALRIEVQINRRTLSRKAKDPSGKVGYEEIACQGAGASNVSSKAQEAEITTVQ